MTRHFAPPSSDKIQSADLLVAAARCWRDARDQGQPVQPCLFGLLSRHDCGMLAPVLDSLMTLCEAALGRGLRTGAPEKLSEDEHLLLGLFDGSRQWHGRAGGAATTFDCALCSTRIMMGRVMTSHRPTPGMA